MPVVSGHQNVLLQTLKMLICSNARNHRKHSYIYGSTRLETTNFNAHFKTAVYSCSIYSTRL